MPLASLGVLDRHSRRRKACLAATFTLFPGVLPSPRQSVPRYIDYRCLTCHLDSHRSRPPSFHSPRFLRPMTNEQPPHIQRVLTTHEAARAYYDKISGVYDLLSERAEEPMRDRGLELLAAQPGERVLEIGCATGHSTISLANSVGDSGHVDAMDLSPKMIRQAEANVHALELNSRVTLLVGDAMKLMSPDSSYDAVFMSFTLELFDTPELSQVLAEIRRVLRPGGRLGVVSVSHEGDESAALKIYEWAHRHLPNLVDCRPIYVRRLLESEGFEISACEIHSMWIPVETVVARKGMKEAPVS